MKNQFLLFWRRDRRIIWIEALIVGISSAIGAIGMLLLLSKFIEIPGKLCLLGAVALPIGTGLFLLFQRSNYKKLAKRLDGDFSLNEKVQTMIAFEHLDDPMVQIQREDTMRRLAQIPTKRLRFKSAWIYCLLPLLACAMMVTGAACPSQIAVPEEEPPYVEPPRDITDWEWAALDELMVYVQNSEADAAVMKPRTYAALSDLRNLLLKGVTESNLTGFVNTTVRQVNNIKEEANGHENMSSRQQQINEEVCRYVVDTLQEIFRIKDTEQEPVNDPSDEGNGDLSGVGGDGEEVLGAEDRLFDPARGYTAYKNVIDAYYSDIDKAMTEGVLSEEEWLDYLTSYFDYLYGSKDTEQKP